MSTTRFQGYAWPHKQNPLPCRCVMPRGGYRPGTGGYRALAGRPSKAASGGDEHNNSEPPQLPPNHMQPLEYMLRVMNDPNAHPDMRSRMAIAAAPYVHAKVGEQGKKDKKHEAAKQVASRFTSSAPPPPARRSSNSH